MERIATVVGCLLLSSCLSDDPISHLNPQYGEDLLASYSNDLPGYEDSQAAAAAPMSGIDMLRMSVPGDPGQDYPIYADIPETSFTCDGRSEGGYYADVEAECQPFHVCSADPNSGGLVKYSFLCPNGTLFNQEHFVCEYWFNVDCASSESFYGLNDNIGEVPDNSLSADASAPVSGYAQPSSSSSNYESPSVAASSQVGYSAPSADTYSPPSPADEQEYGASRTGRLRQGKKVGNRVSNGGSRQSGGRRVKQFRTDSSRRGKSNDNNIEFDRALPASIRDPSPSQQPSTKLNEVNVNRRRPKNRQQSKKKLQGFRREKAKSNTKLSPPGLSSSQESRRGKKVSGRPNDRRKGRQEISTGYLPPVGDNSLSSNSVSDYDYSDIPLPSYNNAAPDTSYSAAAAEPDTSYTEAAEPQESYETPDNSYGAPPADDSYGAPQADASYDDPQEYEYEEEPLPTYNSPASYAPTNDYSASQSAPSNDYSVPQSAPSNDYSVSQSATSNDYSSPQSAPSNDYSSPQSAPSNDYSSPQSSPSNDYSSPQSSPSNDYSAPQSAPSNDYSAPQSSSSNDYLVPQSAPANDYSIPEESYAVPEVSNDVDLAAEVYEEDVLPSYNNGVYNSGSSNGGNRYTAPVAPSIPADSSLNQEDVLPQYNNGVYTSGSASGDSYVAPSNSAPVSSSNRYNSPSSYSSPNTFTPITSPNNFVSSSSSSFSSPPITSSASSSFKPSPPIRSSASSYSSPSASNFESVPGSYQDPEADILPEYHKSEISLGLHNKNEVPRIEPFSNDFGEPLYIGTYKAAGSSVKPVKASAPPTIDTGYGVPAGPTLSNYNIPDISDKGFRTGGSSYGRRR